MADQIKLFPYISTPKGIDVCFTRNGGGVQQKHFAAGTSREAIVAELEGRTLPPADYSAEIAAKNAKEKAQRAAASQPTTTTSEDELKQGDSEKDSRIADLNLMRSALKEAGVKGYQLLKEPALRQRYAELQERKAEKGE